MAWGNSWAGAARDCVVRVAVGAALCLCSMAALSPRELQVAVGDSFRSDLTGAVKYQVAIGLPAPRPQLLLGSERADALRLAPPSPPTVQIMTWKPPKPESVKDFKAPGVLWKAHDSDQRRDKAPVFVMFATKEGDKGGDHKFQGAPLAEKKDAKTHECILLVDDSGSARIERLQGGIITLNEKVSQVPTRWARRQHPVLCAWCSGCAESRAVRTRRCVGASS